MTLTLKASRGLSRNRSAVSKALPAMFMALALTACKHDDNGTQVAGWSLVDPSQRHPIMVSQEPANLLLHVARGSQGLSPSQRADVRGFAGRYKAGDAGNSRLVISAPSGAPNEVAAMAAVDDIRELLLDGGFSESAIAIEAYHDDAGAQPPVRLSYMRYVAQGPDCGHDWSENLAYSRKNTAYPDFGCSNQHNLAAQIANPADLVGPRTEGPRYSERRDDVMGKWTKGETTGAQKSEEEKVRVQGAN